MVLKFSASRDDTIHVWDVQSRDVVVGPLKGHCVLTRGGDRHKYGQQTCVGYNTQEDRSGIEVVVDEVADGMGYVPAATEVAEEETEDEG
jgi:hypothetical protein